MCDCFHIAFPNWHTSPSTGASRRLQGPQDESICDDVSHIEGERPRPQGSSPVEEFPEVGTDTQGGEELSDPLYKSVKKEKRAGRGFVSLFDKRSTPKTRKLEETNMSESGMIVKTSKEACAEGLVVRGGGKEGLFIQEVRPESPASKNTGVKEGDQIISATVYFDDVAYEDALQILERAQPYQVEFCLKRKPAEAVTLETDPILPSEIVNGAKDSSPETGRRVKTKRQGDGRISWPKFPSFSKGRKSRFKRSHSSSEAEEHRQLELSPATSDTESPIKTQDAVKAKTKKHKMKLSGLRMRGRFSRSVDQADEETHIPGPEERGQGPSGINSPEPPGSPEGESPQVYVLEDPEQTGSTPQHKVQLISLDTTLKTTDLTAVIADQESPSGKKSPEKKIKKKKERSELKLRIMGKEKAAGSQKNKSIQKQDVKAQSSPQRLKTLGASLETTEPPKTVLTTHSDASHTELDLCKISVNTETINISGHEKILPSTMTSDVEMSMPKVDLSLDMSEVGLLRQSPKTVREKHLTEPYGIRTRGPLRDIGTPKTRTAEIQGTGSDSITISKTNIEDSKMDVSNLLSKTKINYASSNFEAKITPTIKLPRVDISDTVSDEVLTFTDVNAKGSRDCTAEVEGVKKDISDDQQPKVKPFKDQLPKREDLVIPGMEDALTTKSQVMKQPKPVFTNVNEEIQAETVQMEIDVNRVKEAVSKLPGFKLPHEDISVLSSHQEITKTVVQAEKVAIHSRLPKEDRSVTNSDLPNPETSHTETVTPVILPKSLLSDLDSHEHITVNYDEEKTIPKNTGITLYKREDLEIPGMEAIQIGLVQNTCSQESKEEEATTEESPRKTKKEKMPIPEFGILKSDESFPEIGIEFPKTGISLKGDESNDPELDFSASKETDFQQSDFELKDPNFEYEIQKDAGLGIGWKERKPLMTVSKCEWSKPGHDVDDVPEAKLSMQVEGPEVDIGAPSIDVDVKSKGVELDGQGSKFKMPKFGISLPKVKGPEIDVTVSKTDVDVTLPEAKVDVQLPDFEVKDISGDAARPEVVVNDVEVDINRIKLSFPKFGLSKADIKGPEVDVNLPEVDVSLPEVKMEAKKTDHKIEASGNQVEVKGSPTTFKLPTMKLPKFGLESPHDTVEVPDAKKEVEIDVVDAPDGKLSMSMEEPVVDLEAPSTGVDVKSKGVELERQGSKFKMPKFEISLPTVKGPEIDIDLSRKDKDIILPEAKKETQLPDVEVKGSPTKIKLPTVILPKFGLESPHVNVEVPDVKKEVEIDVVDVPEAKLSMQVQGLGVDEEAPSIDVDMKSKDIELEGQKNKFKMPKFGISLPKVKGPDINVSSPKTGFAVELPEAKADVQIPDFEVKDISVDSAVPEVTDPDVDVKVNRKKLSFPKFGFSTSDNNVPEVDVSLPEVHITLPEVKMEAKEPEGKIKAPKGEVEVKSSLTKFELPKMKLPKFGLESPHVTMEVPDVKKEVESDVVDILEAKLSMQVEGPGVDIEAPSIDVDVKSKGIELDGKGSKFKMPKFGISLPKIKGSEIDIGSSRTDKDLILPEAKAETQLPDVEVKGSPTKFKLPPIKLTKFGSESANISVEVSDANGEITIDVVDIPETKLEMQEEGQGVDIEAPSIGVKNKDIELDGQQRKIKMPKFGISLPKVKGPEIDLSLSKTGSAVELTEAKAEVQLPDFEVKDISGEVVVPKAAAPEIDMKVNRKTFSLPKFGFSKPDTKGPEVDVSLPEVDVSLPEIKMGAKEPELQIDAPECKVEVKSSPTKFKLPTMKLPKFGLESPHVTVEAPDVKKGVEIDVVDVPEANLSMQVEGPGVDIEAPSIDVDVKSKGVELDGQGSKFKMPKFGISLPKVKGPEIDVTVSKTDVDVTLPEAEAEVQLPDVEVKGSPSKFKLPKVKVPKFGLESPHVTVEVPDVKKEVGIDVVDIPEAKISIQMEVPGVDIEAPSIDVDVKSKGVDLEGQGSKFKMPKFGISLPKVKGPEIDLNLSKTGSTVDLPEAHTEVQLPDFEVKHISEDAVVLDGEAPDADVKVNRRTFSLPKFGFSKPDIKTAEVDVSLPEVDVSLPEVKMEAKDPELKIKGPEGEVEVKSSPTKFKLPTMKLPKFGLESPHVTLEAPDVKKGAEIDVIDIPEAKVSMQVEGSRVDVEAPSIDVDVKSKGVELDGQGSKFKMPKFGISLPKVKGPEIDVTVSKTDVDVTLPEAKVDVQLPDFEVKDISGDATVPDVATPDVDLKVNRRKFSFPKFGFSKSDIKAPEVDISLPEVDVSLPEVKMEAKEPELKIKLPEGEVELKSSPTKFKLPTIKLPKYGLESPHVTLEAPNVNKEVEIDVVNIPEAKLSMQVEGPGVDIEAPSIDVDVKSKGVELDGQGSKFKMPKFGISLHKVKGPEIDLSLSKTGSAVELPEPKGEVQLPDYDLKDISVDVSIPEVAAPDIDVKVNRRKFSFPKFGFSKSDIKAPEADVSLPEVDVSLPEVKMEAKEIEIKAPEDQAEVKASPTKFKLPAMKLPKFGLQSPQVTVEVPDVKKEVEIDVVDVPEAKLSMQVEGPRFDIEAPSIDVDVKSKGVELEGQGSKFKMPKFGISLPKVKGPEIDLSLSKTDSAVEIPEPKAEVQLPDYDLKDISVDASIPEVAAPDIDVKVNRRKFSFPKFGFSKSDIKAPEVDVSLPEVDVSLPEVKMETEEPELKIKLPEGEVEVKSSPTKFKLPTIKLPKLGLESPHVTLEAPNVNKEVEIDVVDIPEAKLSMQVEGPGVDIEAPSIDVDVKSKGVELEGQGSKFKMPKFGFSLPKVKGPEIDFSLSKTDSAVELPEAKAKVQLPDFEVKDISGDVIVPEVAAPDVDLKVNKRNFSFPKFGFSKPDFKGPEVDVSLPEVDVSLPEVKVEVKEPEIKIKAPESDTEVKGSPTKFKLPTMKLPKFGLQSSQVNVEVPDIKKEVEIGVVDIPEATLSMQVEGPGVDIEAPSIDVDVKSKGVELEGQASKFKMPKFGISLPKVKGPEIDVSVSKTDIDVKLPEVKAEVELPDFEVREISGNTAALDADLKVNKRKFSFPKFGFSKPDIKGPEVDVSLPEVDVCLPEIKMEVKEPELQTKAPESDIEVKASPTKFKLPSMKLPKFGLQSSQVTVEVPDVKKEVEIDVVDVPEATLSMQVEGPGVDVKAPSIDVDVKSKGVEIEGQGSKFKMPKFGISLPKVKSPEIDVTVSKTDIDVILPEAKADVHLPDFEVKDISGDASVPEVAAPDVDVKVNRRVFSFPKFGFSKPDIKGPEFDVSLPEVDVSLPEVKMEAKDPELKIKGPEGEVEVKSSPTKFKLPTMKFPKFGLESPNVTVEAPDVKKGAEIDVIDIPEAKVSMQVEGSRVDVEAPSIDVDVKSKGVELDGQGSKFKMPKFGISFPKVKGPEIDVTVSKTDVDVTLPEAKVDVQLPDFEVKDISGDATVPDVATPDVDLKVNRKKFSFPKFGFSKSDIKTPEVDVRLPEVDVSLPEVKIEAKEPELKIKLPEGEVEVKSSPTKFRLPTMKLPKFGQESPNVTVDVPDVKTDIVDVPGTKISMQVEGPAVDMEAPSIDVDVKSKGVDLDGQGSKFKMPKFGISFPKVKGPEIDVTVSKTDIDVTLPEAKADVHLPDFEVKGISGDATVPDVAAPEADVKVNRRGFSFPKFGFSKPDIKSPELNVSLPEVDFSLPEVKIETKEPDLKIKAPEGEVEVKSSPTKFKLPTMKFPKFGLESPHVTVEAPDVKKGAEIDVIDIPEAKLTMQVEGSRVDVEAPSIDVDVKSKGVELDGQGSKFKMPRFGISLPKVKGPEIDLNLSKTADDVELPEPKAEVQLPDFEVKGISGDASVSEVAAPDVDVKVNRRMFSFPKFGFSKPDIKGPEVDVSLPEVDVSIPEVKVEAKEIEIKAPEDQAEVKASPTKFKLPTMKLPKFGLESPQVTVEVPNVKKEVEIGLVDVPDAKLSMQVKGPEVDIEAPSIDVEVKSKGVELESQGSKFKMPKFGISLPKVKGPEIDVNLSKTADDVELPEPKAEVQLPDFEVKGISGDASVPEVAAPDVDVKVNRRGFSFPKFGFSKPDIKGPEIDVSLPEVDVSLPEVKVEAKEIEIKAPEDQAEVKASPTKFKLPTMKLPKFGLQSPQVTVEVPDVKKEVEIDVVDIPEAKLSMQVEGPRFDTEAPSIDVDMKSKGVELDGQGSKFKMPKFGISLPKAKGQETYVTVSKTDIDVTLPEAKADVQLPDLEIKDISGDASVPKVPAPDVDVKVNRKKFSFPKFGFSKPDIKGPEVNVSLPEVDVSLPEVKVEVKEPEIKIKAPESDIQVKDSPTNFKLPTMKFPKFGLQSPQVTVEVSDVKKEAEIGLVDVPDAKLSMQVKGPEVDIEAPSIDVEVKSKEVELEGQGSKFKMPKFGISLPKVKGPEIDFSLSKTDSAVELPEAKAEVQLPDFEVKDPIGGAAVQDLESPDVNVIKRRISFPKFGFSKPDMKQTEALASLPESNISTADGIVDIKEPEGEVRRGESQTEVKDVSSPTRFKMPTIKFPKFGLSVSNVTTETQNVETDIKAERPQSNKDLPEQEVQTDDRMMTEATQAIDSPVSPSKFKLPAFKMPRLGVSKSEPEDSHAHSGDSKEKTQNQKTDKEEKTSPSLTMTSFGDILNVIDVEFDVPTLDEAEKKITPSKEGSPVRSITIQNTGSTPEKNSWFKFPNFGKNSPSETPEVLEKEPKDHVNIAAADSVEDDVSLTLSLRSSDAFADISSTVTSEQVVVGSASPTKVMVKYTDPNATVRLGETTSDVFTSTTRTELISLEPNLPEKITIPTLSGTSSSSVDTLKLESGEIHVITSNIQATPEAQQVTVFTEIQTHSATKDASGLSDESSAVETYVVREASGRSIETVVVTERVTHVGGPPVEPISDETAFSIKRLKDTVHSEKMKFFDGTEK